MGWDCCAGRLRCLPATGWLDSKKRSWMHMAVYAVIMASTLYVILDLEYPRFGLIRIDSADQVLVECAQQHEPAVATTTSCRCADAA